VKTLSSAEKIICETCKKYQQSSVDNTNQSGGFLHLRQKIKKYLEKGCCAKILSVKALNPLRRSRASSPEGRAKP